MKVNWYNEELDKFYDTDKDNKKLSEQINNYLKKHEDNIRKSGI